MARSEGLELWYLADRSRFFLVPRGVALPPGAYTLHGLPLRRRRVDLDAMAAWEVDAARARAHVDGSVVGALGRARALFEDVLGLEPEGDDVVPPEEEIASFARGVAGVGAGDLLVDPKRAREAFDNVVDRLGQAARDATPDADERAALKERLEGLRAELLDPEGPVARRAATVQEQVEHARPVVESTVDSLVTGARSVAERLRRELAAEE